MSIYLINITDAFDCDGAGCSVLSLLTLGRKEDDPLTMVTTIAANRNRVDDVLKILLHNIDNVPTLKFPENVMEITHISAHKKDGNHAIILTFTDIPVNTKCMKLVDELAKKLPIPITPYIIDHHKTNTDPLEYVKSVSPDETVWKIENIRIYHEPRAVLLNDATINGKPVTNFYKNRLRSATLLYYEWLCMKGFLRESPTLALFSYEISQYDTFEFDNYYDEDIHCINPDGYTILFNNIESNFKAWVYKMFTKIDRKWSTGVMVNNVFQIDDMNDIEDYTMRDAPSLINPIDTVKISCLSEAREKRYNSTKSKLVIVSNDSLVQFRDVVVRGTIDNPALIVFDNYRVGISFINSDVSYSGNRLCKENPEMDFVIFVDTVSLTVSMRTVRSDIDLSQIAIGFGGGGHPKAAGFPIDIEMLHKLLYIYHVNRQ